MKQVIAELSQLRRRSRALLVAQRASEIVAWGFGLATALIALDYLLRLPGAVRFVLLLGAAVGLGYAVWRYLRPALRFRPSMTQLALRVEQAIPAVAGRLASSVEFAVAGLDETNVLAARSVQETQRRLAGESVTGVSRGARTWRDISIMLVVLGVVMTLGLMNRDAAAIGLHRLLAPFGATQWPARTEVRSLMTQVVGDRHVHPRGRALPLRAEVTKGDDDQRVEAQFRLRTDGRFGAWQRIVLTHQGGTIHERLVDSSADEIELYFETEDFRSPTERIKLVPPPAVVRASLAVTPPSYAAPWFAPTQAELGPGFDERAVTESPSLAGSDLVLTLQFNKPIPMPTDDQALAETLGWEDGRLPSCVAETGSPPRWTLRWRLAGTRTLNLHLTDEYGLSNVELIAYRIEAVEDHPPSVTILEPQSDEPVLRTAVVPLVTEARDDVAVSSVSLEARVQPAGETEAPKQSVWETERSANTPTARLEAELDLGTLQVDVGDTVLVQGAGEDVYEVDDQRHPAARSPVRRLRVISELDLAVQLRRELGVVRQNAIRIETRQAELQDDVIEDGIQPGIDRAQAQIAERVASQRDIVDQLEQRMDVNRLDDEQLGQLFGQVGDLLDYAGRAANQALQEIQQRQSERGRADDSGAREADSADQLEPGEADRGDDRADEPRDDTEERDAPFDELDRADAVEVHEPAEADRPIVEAQQEVREELADLITLLDRDEDTWVATRQLENLLQEQTELEADTAALGRQTLGRSPDELTPRHGSELDRIEERQRDLADQARQAIEDMRRRADGLEDADPQSAAAMKTAADTGEQRELPREMDNAADRVDQNQMQMAQASQQAARQTLQRMLDDIRDTKRARAEELIRRLASLIESIQRLITVQENELVALAIAKAESDFGGRDRAMIRLNQNTQSVAVEARTAGQEARRIARLLDRAADAQGASVIALRNRPVDAGTAEDAENRALELLQEAKQLAEELQEEAEQREVLRQREELIAAYRAFAEREVAVRSDALELAQHEKLDRRQLVEARRLSRAQDEIRRGLDDLQAQTSELSDSLVFAHVHGLMDRLSRRVSEGLLNGDVGVEVTDRQQHVADSIGRLIRALEELLQPPDEFAQQQAGGGGGGGGGQPRLIPPVAELRLLREMQEQVYNQTRDIDTRSDLEPAQRRERLTELSSNQGELLNVGRKIAESLQGPGRPVNPPPGEPQ